MWDGFIWLRIESSNVLLWTRWRTQRNIFSDQLRDFCFLKRKKNPRSVQWFSDTNPARLLKFEFKRFHSTNDNWDLTTCRMVEVYRPFGRSDCFHRQDQRNAFLRSDRVGNAVHLGGFSGVLQNPKTLQATLLDLYPLITHNFTKAVAHIYHNNKSIRHVWAATTKIR